MMRFFMLAVVVLASASTASAHYHILLPDHHSVKVGDKVILTYVFGHPFEHDWFDTEKPTRATLFAPDGKATDILESLKKVETNGHDNKQITGYQYTFQPEGRGDFTIVFESPPIWMADEKHFLRDTARVVGRSCSVTRTAPSGHEPDRSARRPLTAVSWRLPPPRSSTTPSVSVVELTAAT